MAVLQQPVVSGNVFAEQIGDDLAPAGTHLATVLDIVDEFGVQRQKFQSTEIETVDLTTFLFGFRDAQGCEHRVASRRMKISGNEKASLFAFLKSLLGRAPQYGWDYLELRGKQCLLTVEHIQRRDGTGVFAAIAALSPIPAGMAGTAGPQTVDQRPQTVDQRPQTVSSSAQCRPPVGSPATMPARSGPVARTAPIGGAPAFAGGQAAAGTQGRPGAPSPAVAPGGAMPGRPAPAATDPIPF